VGAGCGLLPGKAKRVCQGIEIGSDILDFGLELYNSWPGDASDHTSCKCPSEFFFDSLGNPYRVERYETDHGFEILHRYDEYEHARDAALSWLGEPDHGTRHKLPGTTRHSEGRTVGWFGSQNDDRIALRYDWDPDKGAHMNLVRETRGDDGIPHSRVKHVIGWRGSRQNVLDIWDSLGPPPSR
jgi:hypothetical protein